MTSSLNLNLIIPFKDNRDAFTSYVLSLDSFRDELEGEVVRCQSVLESLFSSNQKITIASRSSGSAKKYFWRLTGTGMNRSYSRLNDEHIKPVIETMNRNQLILLIEIEETLVYVNGNMKAIRGMLDSIKMVKHDIRHVDDLQLLCNT